MCHIIKVKNWKQLFYFWLAILNISSIFFFQNSEWSRNETFMDDWHLIVMRLTDFILSTATYILMGRIKKIKCLISQNVFIDSSSDKHTIMYIWKNYKSINFYFYWTFPSVWFRPWDKIPCLNEITDLAL